jgi:hypothetical protein
VAEEKREIPDWLRDVPPLTPEQAAEADRRATEHEDRAERMYDRLATEFETWQTWVGERVVVTLQKEPDLVEVTGVLLRLTLDGEVDVLKDSSQTTYGWPALDVRRTP